jgi:hypothetical protein
MKKIKNFLIVVPVLVFFISCQKEKVAPPSAFSAVGFWSGSFAGGPLVIDILNRPDGTARIYLRVTTDTALAANRFDGTFTVTGDDYRAQAHDSNLIMKVQTLHTTTTSMEGIVLMTTPVEGQLVSHPFEVVKQQ